VKDLNLESIYDLENQLAAPFARSQLATSFTQLIEILKSQKDLENQLAAPFAKFTTQNDCRE